MTDWNCVLKQNHETCIHQFLKFQATKNEADFKITSQRKTISKFWTSKKIKTLLLWGWSPVFLWNFYCSSTKRFVARTRLHRGDTAWTFCVIMTKYCTEFPEIISEILLKAHWKSDFACQTFGFCVKIEFSWYLSCSEPSISAQNDVFKRSSDEFETKIDQFQTRN